MTPVGVFEVELTEAGRGHPLFAGLPATTRFLQWHGAEVVAPPAGATVLATSSACAVQALAIGERAFGLQFHAEVDGPTLADWFADPSNTEALILRLGTDGAARFPAGLTPTCRASTRRRAGSSPTSRPCSGRTARLGRSRGAPAGRSARSRAASGRWAWSACSWTCRRSWCTACCRCSWSRCWAQPAHLGLIEGVAEATAAIGKFFSGVLSDYLGRRKLLAVLGYGLAALAKPVFALAPSVGWVFAARFVDRLGKGIRGAPRDALIGDLTPVAVRGAGYGLRQSLDTVGAFVGPLLALGLMFLLDGDIRRVFGVAVLPAAIAVGILVFVREPPLLAPAGPRGARSRGPSRRLDLAYWWVVLSGRS